MRILIVDDHEVVRRGVRSLLCEEVGFEVCGEAGDGHDAIQKAKELKPDVVIMDISMPKMNGLEATREIGRLFPEIVTIILSQHDNREMMRQALDAGARAYVVKAAISTDLIAALEKLRRGEPSTESRVFGSAQDNFDLKEVVQRSRAFENELRESNERFRTTFEQAAVGIAHVAEDGRWLRVNQKLCEIVGYTEEELAKVTFQQITHPADIGADVAQAERLAAGEIGHYSVEKRYIRKNGSLVWVNLTGTAVRDASEKLKYFIAVIEDISARKCAEHNLALQMRRQKALFRFADSLNRVGSLDEVYPAAFEAIFAGLECDRSSILLYDARGALHFVSWKKLSDAFRKVAQNYSPWKQSERNPQPLCIADTHGAELPNSMTAALESEGIRAVAFIPLVLQEKLIGRFVIHYNQPHVFTDEEIEFCLTVARQLAVGISNADAKQALAEKASLLDLSSDAIIARDQADRIVYWSDGARDLYGYTAEEVMGRVTHDLFGTVFSESLELIRERLHTENRWRGDLVHRRKDGSKINVSSRWCLARDANGNVKSILETNRDITAELALREIEEKTARKSRAAKAGNARQTSVVSSDS